VREGEDCRMRRGRCFCTAAITLIPGSTPESPGKRSLFVFLWEGCVVGGCRLFCGEDDNEMRRGMKNIKLK